MILKILLLLVCFSLSAKDSHKITVQSQATVARITENDPSSFVEGVNMISGALYLHEEDYAVQGAEPIHLSRSYISGGNMIDYPHLFCSLQMWTNSFVISEPNGSPIIYIAAGHDLRPDIGKEFYGKKNKPLKYAAIESPGVSNTAAGQISALTNRKNQYVLLDPAIDPKGKSFTLYVSDGTKRRYVNVENQKKIKLYPDSPKDYIVYRYKLISEELPNGHFIHYDWKENQLVQIRTGSRNKTFASIPMVSEKEPGTDDAFIKGSDGRALSFNKRVEDGIRLFDSVTGPELPKQTFEWKMVQQGDVKIPYVTRFSMPNGRSLSVDYDENQSVKSLSTPIGVTHRFFYDFPNRNSYAIDALGNKIAFRWDENYRLLQIDRFSGANQPINSEKFVWSKSELISKSLLDSHQNVIRTIAYTYDEFGNIIEERYQGDLSGENGHETFFKKRAYANDARHLLLQESYPNDLKIDYSYRPNTNLLESKTFSDGNVAKIRYDYEYDEDCILRRETIHNHGIKEIIPLDHGPYTGMPAIILEKSSDGKLLRKTRLQYTTGARISQKDVYDANDHHRFSLFYTYDEKGRVVTETNPIGQRAEYAYDEIGNRIYTKDFSGRLETHCKYDCLNRLIEKEEIGFEGIRRLFKYAYDAKNNLIEEIDDRGNITRSEYDPLGNKTKTLLPLGSLFSQSYDGAGNETKTIDAEGNISNTSFNAYGKPVLKIFADGARVKCTYNLDGTVKSQTDPNGIATTFLYDFLSRLISKKIADCEEVYEYEGLNLISKRDFEGNITFYTYDAAGRKIAEECCGEKITYNYDPLGRIWKVFEEDLVTIREYDLLDRVIEERKESVQGELLRIEQYEYDAAGNRSAIIKEGSREEFVYDSLGRLVKKTDPLGNVETAHYENVGPNFRKTHTDPMGLQTIEITDAQNRAISLEKSKGHKTLSLEEKSYNANGQVISQTNTIDSKKISTLWDYDARGRVITLVEAAGTPETKTTRTTYTLKGELAETIKPNGTIIYRAYNDLGYLIRLSSSDGTINYTMQHNRLGHLLKTEHIERTVDHRGRTLTENHIKNLYDRRGRRSQLLVDNETITYEYNALDLKKVSWNGHTHNYLYRDLSGRILAEQLINNHPLTHTYDPIHCTSISHTAFSQKVLQFDSVGNILALQHQNESIDYTYDDLYQLLSETGPFSHTYSYDALYNRLQKDDDSYQHNALNQISSHLEYDLNGNPIRIQDMTLTYDALDRLIHLQTPAIIQTFTYDCLNRCVSKTTNGKTLSFIYDGQNEIGAYDDNGDLVEFRVLGNAPHAEIGAAVIIYLHGKVYTPIHDLFGNIAVLLSPQESTYYRYSAFGEEITSGSIQCPWRFSSKRTDETGFVNFGRRFYLPSLGRWLTPDPAGYLDGFNLYAYVHNDPLTHFDEYGLMDYEAPPIWSHYSWNRTLNKPPPISLYRKDCLDFDPSRSYWYYLNGIKNTRSESRLGAIQLLKTADNNANIIPFHSESRGSYFKEIASVLAMRSDPNYTSPDVRRLSRNLKWDIMVLNAMEDPRKIFITSFSRGAGVVYHSIKNFSLEEKNRLIITACGPTMLIPRDFGFKVNNIISGGDWCSLFFHRGFKRDLHKYESFANVTLLEQLDGFKGFNRDHFFMSKTYQTGIKMNQLSDYEKYGKLE